MMMENESMPNFLRECQGSYFDAAVDLIQGSLSTTSKLSEIVIQIVLQTFRIPSA